MNWEPVDAWLETTEHLYQCIGYSEGMACCLEKEEIRRILERLLTPPAPPSAVEAGAD